MSNSTASMLNPQLFRPDSAEQKRAKKREAQRKYRRHLRQSKKEKDSDETQRGQELGDRGTTRSESTKSVSQLNSTIVRNDESATSLPTRGGTRTQKAPQMENHEPHTQRNPNPATVHFVSPQPTHPFPASFEHMFPVANASLVEKGSSLPLSDQQLPVYHTPLLNLPIELTHHCDLFPLQHDTDNTTPRTIPTTSWSHFENANEPPETGQTFAHSSPLSQGLRQSSILHDTMNDEMAAQPRRISTQAISSHSYSSFPPAAQNLPSPAPSHNGEGIQKKPSQPTITPLDLTASAQVSPMNPVVVNPTQELQGCTPIFQAVALGNLNIASILVARGCNVNAVNGIGQTVLHVAAQNGQIEMIEYLITCGMDLDHQDNGGNTALHMAVINGYEGIVELLVNAGAKMDIMNN